MGIRSWAVEVTKPGPGRLEGLAQLVLERCRGEGPANCEARCPLRVDAHGYVQLVKYGRFREALQLIREALPFPGVLGYLCSAPCESYCKRLDIDRAIRVRDLKRFLVEWEEGEPQHVLSCAPATGKRVAVVGAGASGLLAAHDLGRYGHEVVLFEREHEIGGGLRFGVPEWRLPRRVLERDLSILRALGIRVVTGVALGGDLSLGELSDSHDAVVLAPGFRGGTQLVRQLENLRPGRRGTVRADPVTCETGIPGVFACGDAVSGPSTVVDAMATGRRAAESARRFLSGNDLLVGRSTTVLPPPLLWELEIDEGRRRARGPRADLLSQQPPVLTPREATLEGELCLDCVCDRCVQDCSFLASYCSSPREIARRLTGGLEQNLTMVYSCNLCGLCAAVCPVGLDIGELVLQARRRAVASGWAPLPQHRSLVFKKTGARLSALRLVMAEPGRSRAKRVLVVGHALPASSPLATIRLYDSLRRAYPGLGIIIAHCCSDAEHLGAEDADVQARSELEEALEALGAEEIVLTCPGWTFAADRVRAEKRVSFAWELLSRTLKGEHLRQGVTVAVHDPCRVRQLPEVHAAARALIRITGAEIEELEHHGVRTRCCGLGGGVPAVNPELSRTIAARVAAETEHVLVTYCAGCRAALARTGTRCLHLVDFLFTSDWRRSAALTPPRYLGSSINLLRAVWALRRLSPSGASGHVESEPWVS